MMDGAEQALRLLEPPPPPTDLIQSALFIPLQSISFAQRSRKIRTIGQILAYDLKSSKLLLSHAPLSNPPISQATILVDISIPLLGQTPSLKPLDIQDNWYTPPINSEKPSAKMDAYRQAGGKWVNRENAKLDRGEWVCVVGWLEGDGRSLARHVEASGSYAAPLPLILEAIHISMSRPPPQNATHRGGSASWSGVQSDATCSRTFIESASSPILIDDEEHQETPRRRRR